MRHYMELIGPQGVICNWSQPDDYNLRHVHAMIRAQLDCGKFRLCRVGVGRFVNPLFASATRGYWFDVDGTTYMVGFYRSDDWSSIRITQAFGQQCPQSTQEKSQEYYERLYYLLPSYFG